MTWRGRKTSQPTTEYRSIEAAAFEELRAVEPDTLSTAALDARLRQRGFQPQNLTTTLLRSRRILSKPRSEPTDRYRWYVNTKPPQPNGQKKTVLKGEL